MLQVVEETGRSPMITVDVAEAKTRLRELLEKVEAGEGVVITRDGEPVAFMEAVATKPTSPKTPIDFEALEALRARLPPWSKDSSTLIREMRDEEW